MNTPKKPLLIKLIILFSLALLISGCASNFSTSTSKMVLVKGQDTVDVSKRSVGLLFVRLSNQYKPSYQPSMFGGGVVRRDDSKVHIRYFRVNGSPYRSEKNQFNEYLLTLDLDPGTYDHINIGGRYYNGLIMADTEFHLKTQLEIKPNAVVYLGHLDATIRERMSDSEVRAGLFLPLIDSHVAGYASGTYEIKIQDNFDDDIKLFKNEYPGLQKVKIEKAVIPASTVLDSKRF